MPDLGGERESPIAARCGECECFLGDCRCGEYEDGDAECSMCGGEGCFFGEELPAYDPGWHIADKTYPCPSCNGTGNRRDMTIW